MPYTPIVSEGGLLPTDILDAIAAGELPGQRPEDFGLERTRNLSDRIAAAWQAARGQWALFQSYLADVPPGETAISETRAQWGLPLLRVLGYPLARNRRAYLVQGRTYAISHRAGEADDTPPVHIVSIRNSLDARPHSGRSPLSPHALVQEYLNSTEQLWGIVTNGERLRLLRDSSRFTCPAYVEFDLRSILEGEQFSAFVLLYRLLHRSRMPVGADDASVCLLERYHQQAVDAGGRVRGGEERSSEARVDTQASTDEAVEIVRDITERTRIELERLALIEIMQGAAASSEIHIFLKLVQQALVRVISAENMFVRLLDPRTGVVDDVYTVDKHGLSLVPALMAHSRAAYVCRVGHAEIFTPESFEALRLCGEVEGGVPSPASWLGTPLAIGERIIGVLAVFDYERRDCYAERHKTFLCSVAAQVALAIDRRKTEEALRENEARLGEAQRIAHLGVWDLNLHEDYLTASDEACRIFGLQMPVDDASSETFLARVHPDDREWVAQIHRESIAAHQPFDLEYRLLLDDGQVKHVHERGITWYNHDGQPTRSLGTMQDISEAKRSTEEITRLSRVVEQMEDLVIITDVSGEIQYVNPAFERLFGYRRIEVLGKTPRIIKSGIESVEFYERLWATILRGESFHAEICNRRKDGLLIYEDKTITPIRDERGVITHFVATGKNITARKQMEYDLQKRLKELTCLRQVQRMLETTLPQEDLCRQVVAYLIPAMQFHEKAVTILELDGQRYRSGLDEAPLLCGLSASIVAGGVICGQLCVAYIDASPFIIPEEQNLLDGITHSLGLWFERQQAEDDLIKERNSLARRVDERTADLSRTNMELARAVRAKDEFLANMSHELRTPLNAILGLSESLQEQYRGPINERQRDMIGHIETSGRHLLTLINDILDLSKVEAGRMEMRREVVAISEICEASMLFVKEQALKKQLKLAFRLDDQMARVEVDPKRLKQILVNLLTNAVKFTEPGGRVSLDVTVDDEEGVVRFIVQDSGIGIALEGLAQLFQPFVQLDSRLNRQHEGTGLGLALVRRLTELHGGSVTVESELGKGSRFIISVPYTPSTLLDVKGVTAPTSNASALRSALVIEDSGIASEQITRYLQELHIHATVYGQGEGALERISALQPDVIFLDLQIPGLSGWEVLTRLKTTSELQGIPVIIISVVDEHEKGLAAGAAEYLLKPISRDDLRRALAVAAADQDAPHEAAIIAPQNLPPTVADARILLAEDNEINIIAVGDYLQDRGYHLTVARNGREALDMAEEVRPDLILMDIQMPEIDGLAATRRLRAMPAFAATPIIALTALAMPGDRERCLEAGANEYLTKPVSLKGLMEVIQQLVGRPTSHL